MSNATAADGGARKGKLGQRIAYACGNLGQSAFYNAMSTYFVVYVTSCLFSGVDKALASTRRWRPSSSASSPALW